MQGEDKAVVVVNTDMLVTALQQYLYPMRDYDNLLLEIEAEDVIRLVHPTFPDYWKWDVDEGLLITGVKTILDGGDRPDGLFTSNVEVDVDFWDVDLGDGNTAYGYRLLIAADLSST